MDSKLATVALLLCLVASNILLVAEKNQPETPRKAQDNTATFRGSLARTGYFPCGLGKWQAGEERKTVVYIVADYKYLYALDAETGKELWKVETGCESGSPYVIDGALYIGSGIRSRSAETHLYALNARTGKEIWKAKSGGQFTESLVVAGGVVYAGSMDHYLYAIDAKSGKELWKARSVEAPFSPPTVYDGAVYVGSQALDAKTGKKFWGVAAERLVISGSPTVVDGVAYVGPVDGYLQALDAKSGKEIWKVKLEERITSSLAFTRGVVYTSPNGKYLYAFEARTGKNLWKVKVGVDEQKHPGYYFYFANHSCPVIVDGVVYYGANDRRIYALDARTGKEKWKTQVRGVILGSSPALANGVLYVGDSDGYLYALNAKTGKMRWEVKTEAQISSSPSVASGCDIGT